MIVGKTVVDRLKTQPSMYDCIQYCGVAIDAESAIQVTAFCWANGMDFSLVAYDVEGVLDE